MPWIRKGKCVYKKNKDGSKGEKEGCSSSDEKAKKYLKNLYRIEGEKTKKENKKMKMKKSELLALIKEEIMDEMHGLTMMDDPHDDETVPAGMERGGAMDQVAKEMELTVISTMDDAMSMISNYLVTQGRAQDPQKAATLGMSMLRDAGFRPPELDAVERMIGDEMGDDDDFMMQEGIENITPENLQLVMEAVKKLVMSPYTGPMIVAAFAAVGLEGIREMLAGRGGDQ